MKALYIAWQDSISHSWFPVGCLTFLENGSYEFLYTKGAEMSPNFVPFSKMQDLYIVYESETLFPFFANRLLSKSRPEFTTYLEWLNMASSDYSPFMMLASTGGTRGTDSFEVFPCPEKNDNDQYEVRFFDHGLRHLGDYAIDRVSKLKPNDRLYLMADRQNRFDSLALAIRSDEPPAIIGYCPRYFCEDFHELLTICRLDDIEVSVERVNHDAPIQLRLLCKLVAPWPEAFQPCSSEAYFPLPKGVKNSLCTA